MFAIRFLVQFYKINFSILCIFHAFHFMNRFIHIYIFSIYVYNVFIETDSVILFHNSNRKGMVYFYEKNKFSSYHEGCCQRSRCLTRNRF